MHPKKGPAMTLTLISHRLCPYVQRAVIVLQEKGVPYERVDIDLANKPAWFLALSPLGKTPVLVVDGTPVFESAVICEYLDETFEPKLHPDNPLERARHRAWIEFASATLNAVGTFYSASGQATYEAAATVLHQRFAELEKTLGSGPYFAGERFTLPDAAYAPVFRYLDVFDPVTGIDFMAGRPKVQAWRAALARRSSVRTAVGPDYAGLLRAFVSARPSVLGALLAAQSHDDQELAV